MPAVRRSAESRPAVLRPAIYPTPKVYGAILALRRRGERVENYCRDRRLHVIGNAILGDAELLARAESDYSRPSTPSTNRSAQRPD